MLRGRWRAGVVVVTAGLMLSAPSAFADEAAAPAADTGGYASLDRPGPPLAVPAHRLRAAVVCSPGVADADRDPILLVPGTGLTPTTNFSWNYVRAFEAAGLPWCALTLPDNALGDIQVAGEYAVHALRHVSGLSGRKVDVLGFSQGGMVPRWALRFWPDTRALVDDLVGLAPSNHGTVDAQACLVACPAAFWQQRTTARFLDALNSGAETFAGIDYTVVYTRFDEVVVPNLDAATGSSSLRTGDGTIANLASQDVCPLNVADHLAMGSYDPVGYAAALDAFDHPGPASAARIPRSVCSQPFHPGVNPLTFALDYAGYSTSVGAAVTATPQVPAEPRLRRYVY